MPLKIEDIAYCTVYPPIGVARVGNSPNEDGFFIGPEVPNQSPKPDDGKFKDSQGRIKRQAARFRIYAFDANHVPSVDISEFSVTSFMRENL